MKQYMHAYICTFNYKNIVLYLKNKISMYTEDVKQLKLRQVFHIQ